MILSKSKIYELKIISSLKHEKIKLTEFRTNEIPNWKRKRLSRFVRNLGLISRESAFSDLAIVSGRSDLLEYYGDNVQYMRSCIEGNRPDLIDKNMVYAFQILEYQDLYDTSESVSIALRKRNYGILFYIWELIDKSSIYVVMPEKLKKYLTDWEKMSKHVPTPWD